MFWSQEQARLAAAVRDRADEQRHKLANFTMTTDDARKHSIGHIEWMAEYERKANERQAAWEASPFYDAWCRLFAFKGSSSIVHT